MMILPMDRNLAWDGCFNIRDLGGLRTTTGGVVARGAVVRSENPERLTAAGWTALWDHGVRTVVDLRDDHERGPDRSARPAGLTTVNLPLDDSADTAFWSWCWEQELDGSPLYYRPFLERKAARAVAVIAAVARVEPGGVLVHCVRGRDRTGMIVALLLMLAGATVDDVVADYELSAERLRAAAAAGGEADDGPAVLVALERKGTTSADALRDLLTEVDLVAVLHAAGLTDADHDAVHDRLLGPAG